MHLQCKFLYYWATLSRSGNACICNANFPLYTNSKHFGSLKKTDEWKRKFPHGFHAPNAHLVEYPHKTTLSHAPHGGLHAGNFPPNKSMSTMPSSEQLMAWSSHDRILLHRIPNWSLWLRKRKDELVTFLFLSSCCLFCRFTANSASSW